MLVPALYETDDGLTANGDVHPFCSEKCREQFRISPSRRGFGRTLLGETHTEEFGFAPRCERCGTTLRPCSYKNWGQPCVLVAGHGGDHERTTEASMRSYP